MGLLRLIDLDLILAYCKFGMVGWKHDAGSAATCGTKPTHYDKDHGNVLT